MKLNWIGNIYTFTPTSNGLCANTFSFAVIVQILNENLHFITVKLQKCFHCLFRTFSRHEAEKIMTKFSFLGGTVPFKSCWEKGQEDIMWHIRGIKHLLSIIQSVNEWTIRVPPPCRQQRSEPQTKRVFFFLFFLSTFFSEPFLCGVSSDGIRMGLLFFLNVDPKPRWYNSTTHTIARAHSYPKTQQQL